MPTIAWQAPNPHCTHAPGRRHARTAPRPRKAPKPRRPGVRVDGLQDLATITRQLREQRERAERKSPARSPLRLLEAERQLFSRAVGQVHPLTDRNLAELPTTPVALPLQHWLDEERVLMESISDDFDVSSLLDTDDQLSFRRPGIGVEITRRLRSGHWSIQRQLGPARPARGRSARSAGRIHPPRAQAGRALRARGARQGPGFARQKPGAQRPCAELAGAKRKCWLCASPPHRWWRGALLVLLQPARTA